MFKKTCKNGYILTFIKFRARLASRLTAVHLIFGLEVPLRTQMAIHQAG